MDFTKITPIELNGQRVATTGYLYSYLAEVYKLNYRTAERRITKARHSITLDKDADYFVDINVGSPIYYTKSGVIKLSDYRNVEVLKDFAAVYFDTDALPATEPAEVETPDVTDLIPVEWSAQRVLTTEQLAQFYQCNKMQIIKNFNNNKDKFIDGKHYFKLEGEELDNLRIQNLDMQISPMTRALYLWTREGAVRHCKMLNTVKAWEMFNLLEDNYFNGAKDAKKAAESIDTLNVRPKDIINEIGETRDAIIKVFGANGIKEGMALAQSLAMAENFFNQDLSGLRQFIPAATHEIGTLNATQLGLRIGKSARETNSLLVQKGFQEKISNVWRLTEKGKQYAELKPYTNPNNGHSDYQIMWNPQIVTVLLEEVNH